MKFRTCSAPPPHHGAESQGRAVKEEMAALRTIRTFRFTRMRT